MNEWTTVSLGILFREVGEEMKGAGWDWEFMGEEWSGGGWKLDICWQTKQEAGQSLGHMQIQRKRMGVMIQ